MDVLHSVQGDSVERLIWRERRLGPEDLGRILDLNPGVAALGAILPIGTAVNVPENAKAKAKALPLIQLWD